MKLSEKKLSRAIVLFSSLMCISIPAYANQNVDVIKDKNLTKADWNVENPTWVRDSTITAKTVSFKNQDDSNTSSLMAPFLLDHKTNLAASQGVEVSHIQVGGYGNPYNNAAGFGMEGATLFTPKLEIHDIATSKDNARLFANVR